MTPQPVTDALNRPYGAMENQMPCCAAQTRTAYTPQFQRLLTYNDVICSMSRLGNVLDNAAMESFFSSLKRNRSVKSSTACDQTEADVFDHVEGFYNPTRRHPTLGLSEFDGL
ncbi:MAG: hypothetical protein QM647_15865 [Asticcacaulis sp.]|uniref:hypothetical protein n=1 Tax=Asticcacaulis sp. TaxID=1872648 RepID=UPI0039E69281